MSNVKTSVGVFLFFASSLVAASPRANTPVFLAELRSTQDYTRLAHTESGLTFVKYTLDLADGAIYFQNTEKYPFHFPFLKNEIARFRDLTSAGYEEILFSPGAKAVLAGAVYLSESVKIPELTEKGVMGFNVYFKEGIYLPEIVHALVKLRNSIPFAREQLAFVFERRADYFKYKTRLWPSACKAAPQADGCIPSLPLDRLIRP